MDLPPTAQPMQTTGAVPVFPPPPNSPIPEGMSQMAQPLQIALPRELKTILDEWPKVRADLDALKAKPTPGGNTTWQALACFLLGGSLMAFAVWAWPYVGRFV